MDVKVYESPGAFELPEWRQLHSAYPNRNIFSTPEWSRLWWEEFGSGKFLFVLVFLDPDPVGIAPLVLDGTDEGGRVRFVGGDDLTDYLGPIWSEDRHLPAIADALVGFLKEEIGGWGYFDAKCLPVTFGFADRLVEAADRWGIEFSIDHNEITAVLPLPGTFEEYLQWLRPKQRHELRRKLRRFAREVPDGVLVTGSSETLSADVLTFIDLHRGSRGLKGKFMLPERATFFARVAQTFQPAGLLSLDFLETGGRRIASTFGFPFERTFYLYNSAYDPDAAHLSPGLVLAARLIERSIQQGMERVDFLRGPERYKFDLGAAPIPLHGVRLTNKKGRYD